MLRLSINFINDTMGTKGLVLSLLVFGKIPSFSAHSLLQTTQTERFSTPEVARAEMETIVALNLDLKKALKSELPPAKYLIRPGDQVCVYREKSKYGLLHAK